MLAELEEGGDDYVDRELWEKVISRGKRKMKAADCLTEDKKIQTVGNPSSTIIQIC